MQDPPRTRPADLASSSRRDLLAGHEARLTPLIHARVSDREPGPGAQLRAHALVGWRALDDRLTTTRGMAATGTATHTASAVHIPTALDQEITETAVWHSRADGLDWSADARDKLHPLPNHRETGR